jgi:hypothetical protein
MLQFIKQEHTKHYPNVDDYMDITFEYIKGPGPLNHSLTKPSSTANFPKINQLSQVVSGINLSLHHTSKKAMKPYYTT